MQYIVIIQVLLYRDDSDYSLRRNNYAIPKSLKHWVRGRIVDNDVQLPRIPILIIATLSASFTRLNRRPENKAGEDLQITR